MVHLDGPLYYLGPLERPLLLQAGPPLALLFTSCDKARQFPSAVTGLAALEVRQAGDWRAKEELFKALLLMGIEVYLLDPSPQAPLKAPRHAVRAALVYTQGQKRHSACL